MVSTYYPIRQHQFQLTLQLAKLLLKDKEDLIHKAVGWMLREVGKRERSCLDKFLLEFYQEMPRTMLRYAIEKHSPIERTQYLKGLL